MYHYLYKIKNLETNEYYVGVRSCNCLPEDDPYMGSSSVWTKDYIKANRKILQKEILDSSFETRKLANGGEVELLEANEGNESCINVLYGLIPSHLGRKQTQEWIAKRTKYGEENGMFGKHHTEEAKKAMSEKLLGREVSEDARQRIGEAQKNRVRTEEEKEHISDAAKAAYKKGTRKSPCISPCTVKNMQTGETETFSSLQAFSDKYELNYFSMKACARQNGKYKHFKIDYVASSRNTGRTSGENGETPELDNPVGSLGSD
jgi:hypothetical protein